MITTDYAIELLKRVKAGDTCTPGWDTLEAFDMAIAVLEKQEADRWIPVTERLPEKEGCYLVSVKNDHQRKYSKTAWFNDGSWTMVRQKVLAWRPLPAPYQEDKA